MTSSDIWDEEDAERYDEISAEKFAPHVLGPTVDVLARLAGAGPALELAVGTGRVAIPLAARGIPVVGIELSQPMVDQLRRKAPEQDLPVVTGDSECDLMARLAGLQLEQRVADWDQSPFTSDSQSHISVWRKPVDGLDVG